MRGRARSDGFLRLTKVGLWFLIFLVIVAVAATNTGNNGLFLVLAFMTAVFVVSHLLAGRNVRGLRVALEAPGEVFVNRPAVLNIEITNRGWIPRWLLVLSVDPRDVEPRSDPPKRRSAPFLASYLEPGKRMTGKTEMMLRRRGRRRIRRAHVTSLFPLGFFRKGRRFPVDLEMLVYPEIFQPSTKVPEQLGYSGEENSRRPGWGHELLGLRSYRPGDDPRGIHWKQSARTGELIFKERESEENRRLMIVFDNAVGKLTPAGERRFERLVSEAATAALNYLERGFEVSLTTREETLPFYAGARQRRAILETLALIEAREEVAGPLGAPAGTGGLALHLTMESEEKAA